MQVRILNRLLGHVNLPSGMVNTVLQNTAPAGPSPGRRAVLFGLPALALAACVTPVDHGTPSGRPEVMMATTDTTGIKSDLVNRMLNKGYGITRDSGFVIAFDRPVDNVLAAAMLGSQYDSVPNARIVYTIARTGNTTRVIADIAIITNPGSAFERPTPFNNSQDSLKVQAMLNEMAQSYA